MSETNRKKTGMIVPSWGKKYWEKVGGRTATQLCLKECQKAKCATYFASITRGLRLFSTYL